MVICTADVLVGAAKKTDEDVEGVSNLDLTGEIEISHSYGEIMSSRLLKAPLSAISRNSVS